MQVDGRDQYWGLLVWVVALLGYFIYIAITLYQLCERRTHPSTSTRILDLTQLDRKNMHKDLTSLLFVRELYVHSRSHRSPS